MSIRKILKAAEMRSALLFLMFFKFVVFAETWYVDPNNSGSQNGSSGSPYISLYAALNAKCNKTFTEPITIICRTNGGKPDTTAVSFGGWTQYNPSATNYLLITVDNDYRHAGVWDTTKYRLSTNYVGQTTSLFNPAGPGYITVDGIQFSLSNQTGTAELIYWACNDSNGVLKNCIIKGAGSSSMTRLMSVIHGITAYNTILYNAGTNGSADAILNHGNSKYYNMIIIGPANGNGLHILDGTVIAKNCFVRADPGYEYYLGGGSLTNTNCVSSGLQADDFGGSGNIVSVAFDTSSAGTGHAGFQDTGMAKADFRIKSTSPFVNAGVDLSSVFTTDIRGLTRSGTWDIGAYEYGTSCTPATIARASTRVDTIGQSGRFRAATITNSWDSLQIVSWPDSSALVAKTTKDTVAYRWKAKATKAGYKIRVWSCTGTADSTYDTVTIAGPSVAYASSPVVCTVGVAMTKQTVTSTALADSFNVVSKPAWMYFDVDDGDIYGTPTAVTAKTGYKVVAFKNGVRADSSYDTITVVAHPLILGGITPAYGSSTAEHSAKVWATNSGFPGAAVCSLWSEDGAHRYATTAVSNTQDTAYITIPVVAAHWYKLYAANGDAQADTLDSAYQSIDLPALSYATKTCTTQIAMSWTPSNAGGAVDSVKITGTALPTGLSMAKTTGIISGTATATEGITGHQFTAWNKAGTQVAYCSLTVIAHCVVPGITRHATGTLYVGEAMAAWDHALTGDVDSVVAIDALPTGLSIAKTGANKGRIAGTPTVAAALAGYRIRAYGCSDSATVYDSIFVCERPTISYASGIVCTLGIAITALDATLGGGTTDSVKTITVLPSGLSVAKTGGTMGRISGTATAGSSGTYWIKAYGCAASSTSVAITVTDTTARRPVSVLSGGGRLRFGLGF